MITSFRIFFISILVTTSGFSQTFLDIAFPNVKQQSLTDFLVQVKQHHSVKVYYIDEWLAGYEVGEHFNGFTLRKILDETLVQSGVSYEFLFGYALIFYKDPAGAMERESILNRALVQRKTVEQKVIGNQDNYRPGKPVVLTGVIRDKDTGKPIEGVSVVVNEKNAHPTDLSGRFRLSLLPGKYVLTVHQPQYDDKVIDLEIYDAGELSVQLQETPIILGEVVIADEAILDKAIGTSELNISQIRRAPLFLGEADVIKQVQSQPGVTTVGEIASGFNVRGGSVDQNLVLFDDVPIFNTSHALGFFTAFNPDAVGDVSFYRGGIPAQYGGRASSILNVSSKQGEPDRWKVGGGIGIISSHLTASGPIKKDTTSVHLSLRSTYSNWMLRAVASNYEDVQRTSLSFYDGSLNLSHRFNDKSKLTFSAYNSRDQFSLSDDTTFYWGNAAASMKFDHAINDKLFSSVSLSYGSYHYTVREENPTSAFDLTYGITYPSLKLDFQVDGAHILTFGLHNTFYRFDPGELRASSPMSNVAGRKMDREEGLESALYFGDAFNLSEDIFLEAGLRLSLFNVFGPATVYKYRSGQVKEVRNVQDSVVWRRGAILKSYAATEPRVSLRYKVNPNMSLKVGYHRMVQYMHLITNTTAIMPTDIWQPSNTYFKPQVADQISLGIFRNFRENIFETFVEAYLKRVQNTVDFKDGADLILNRYLETAVVPTSDTGYGVEASVTKVSGRLQGTFNYTYSRSYREYEGGADEESINRGNRYPTNHDQPHVLNLNWRYGISRRLFFSGNFVYHTGRPTSMPSSVYVVDGVPVSNFAERNQYRLPDYHRLDMAFIIEGNHKRKKPWTGHWILSFYNVYGRKNAYSVFFADDGTGNLQAYRLSVIGTIIPSLSYSFKF